MIPFDDSTNAKAAQVLSEPQKRILLALKSGIRVYQERYMSGYWSRVKIQGERKFVIQKEADALRNFNLIRRLDYGDEIKYRLTEAGRAAAAKLEREEANQ